MLAVARSSESSYANKRAERAHFEADAMLAVARAPTSSYAEMRCLLLQGMLLHRMPIEQGRVLDALWLIAIR
jgi:hypothetical protein